MATAKKKTTATPLDKQEKSRKPAGRWPKGVSGNPKTQWGKGESGNPAGRPKWRTLSEELRARLEEQYPGRPDATYARMVAETLIDMAIKNGGSIAAIAEIFDRVEGKPRQAIELTAEKKMREVAENIVKAFMVDAGLHDLDEAARILAATTPEIARWIN